MARKEELDIELLRNSVPRDMAAHLRRVFASDPAAVSTVTSQLISHVASEAIPPFILSLWPLAANDPSTIVAVMQQEVSVTAQRSAIKHFYRHLRREKTFQKAWEAIGGAAGTAELMAKLSVDNVRLLINLLRDTGRALGAHKARQSAMEELLRLLWPQDGENSAIKGGRVEFDSRPLLAEYAKLVPACGGAFRLEWEEKKRQLPENYYSDKTTDHEFFEHHYNEKLRRNEITASEFLTEVRSLVSNRTAYGMHILEKFTESDTLLGASPTVFLEVLVDPLGRRFLSKTRISSNDAVRYWGLVIRCLRDREAFQRDFDNSGEHYKRIISRLVKMWNHSRAQAEYTDMLVALFSHVPETAVKNYPLTDFINGVAPALRYQLLRLFLKHTAGNGFDIGEPTSLEHSEFQKTQFRWSAALFFQLSADEALPLFEKVQRAGRDVGFWNTSVNNRFLYETRDEEQRQLADYHIIQALLLSRYKAVSPFTTAELEAMRSEIRLQELPMRMKKATQGRHPETRAQWAVSALSLCLAIGDLTLYAETLLWARRFNKDSLTVKELYSRYSFPKSEGMDLLTVLPPKEMKSTISLGELTKSIRSANEVLHILCETTLMSTSEPSFNDRDWEHVFITINGVIRKRISRVNDFQDASKISDDALYEALWKPTLAMLEKMIRDLYGPAGERFTHLLPPEIVLRLKVNKPESLRSPTIKFLNAFAEFFDDFNKKNRIRDAPVLVTADELWPKGLALLQLWHHFGDVLAYLPHTQSRIEKIVFLDPRKVLKPIKLDDETQRAIGICVDTYSMALRLYIQMPGSPGLSKKAQCQERITKAWKHATVNLSKSRMTLEEAERFWVPVFQLAGAKLSQLGIDEKANQRSDPAFPKPDKKMRPIEWNPDPDYDRISQPRKDKTLTPTYLDVLISKRSPWKTYEESKTCFFDNVKAVIPRKPLPSSYWYSVLIMRKDLTCKSVDAYVTAGILALNTEYGSDISLLKTPFPDDKAVRIPPVYLDEEFLERETHDNSSGILAMLVRLKQYVPMGLLVKLATSILESIKKRPDGAKPYDVFMSLIKLILKGSNPSLAIPLVQQFVLENPDASAWHRVLLNPRCLINLLPRDAKNFFESFTEAILDKLQEQAKNRVKEPDAAANKGPLVKVTTVKMLAQLLRESPVVDHSLAVDLNTSILKRASHVDIRIASVKGLTEAIDNTTSPVVRRRILDALLQYAAPIASSVNEAQPSTDWDALTSSDELPEVRGDDFGNLLTPPIMKLIMWAGLGIASQSVEGQALRELKHSVLDASAENNRRWMDLFLKKHGFSVPDNAQFPAVPVFPDALDTLLHVMKSETSFKYIDLMKQYILLRLNPPDWLSSINKAVSGDQKLSISNAGRHWYNLWSSDSPMYVTMVIKTISGYLRPKRKDDAQSIEFYKALEQFIFEIADATLMRAKSTEFQSFWETTSSIDPECSVWTRILDRINSLRTPAWQNDPHRKPAVLPDTLQIKMRMLNLPYKSSKNPEEAKATVARCANGAIELIEEIVSTGGPYFHSFNSLKNELGKIESMAEMALLIGSTPALDDASSIALVDYLRVELAVKLFTKSNIFMDGFGKAHDKSVVEEGKKLVAKMSESCVENFRTLAAPLKASIENEGGFDWWS